MVATGCAAVAAQETTPVGKPNFVLTDDQAANTLAYMPAVRENLIS